VLLAAEFASSARLLLTEHCDALEDRGDTAGMPQPMTDVRVATWNVLASAYCLPERYPDCPQGWDDQARRVRSIADIVAYLASVADVVCLQEVDEHILEELQSTLPNAGLTVAWHRLRRDAVAVLTSSPTVAAETFTAGDMAAASVTLDRNGVAVRVVATHLEWSPSGDVGRAQLSSLLADLAEDTVSLTILAMDANDSPTSTVCEPLRSGGWVTTPAHDTALIADRGWVPLDLIAARGGKVELVEVLEGGGTIPSLTWPADHLALIAAVSV
jgi:mRNA deadenylase 3'-5' endonuclease subunit Ccr4